VSMNAYSAMFCPLSRRAIWVMKLVVNSSHSSPAFEPRFKYAMCYENAEKDDFCFGIGTMPILIISIAIHAHCFLHVRSLLHWCLCKCSRSVNIMAMLPGFSNLMPLRSPLSCSTAPQFTRRADDSMGVVNHENQIENLVPMGSHLADHTSRNSLTDNGSIRDPVLKEH